LVGQNDFALCQISLLKPQPLHPFGMVEHLHWLTYDFNQLCIADLEKQVQKTQFQLQSGSSTHVPVTRGSAALRTLVTWVVLIASRDGFFNPLKPNSQDYTNLLILLGIV
jgi:hypothetical protein